MNDDICSIQQLEEEIELLSKQLQQKRDLLSAIKMKEVCYKYRSLRLYLDSSYKI